MILPEAPLLFWFVLAGNAAPPPAAGSKEDVFFQFIEELDVTQKVASDKTGERYGTPEEVQRETKKLMEEILPLREALRALTPRYALQEDPKVLAPERERLRRGIQSRRKRFNFLRRYAQKQKLSHNWLMARDILSGDKRRDVAREIGRVVDGEAFYSVMHGFESETSLVLYRDRKAYENALAAVKNRRRLRRVVLPGGVTLLLGLAGLFWFLRRSSRTALAPAAVPGPPPAPAVIGGHFRVERELGHGGMGVVYLAEDATLARKVAIKRMRARGGGPKELGMFLSEARLSAALKHPNIVEIYHIFTEDEQVHLVFEFVLGKTLETLLEGGKPLHVNRVAHILRQMAQGLDFAHGKKIIHRDLKPANIMLAEDNTVKIMDFGLAHQAHKTVARQTKAEAWGTPPYMAPEQEIGKVSRESDIFALGACAYEMLTGTPAFDGPNYLAQKREMIFKPPSAVAPQLPKGMDAVIRKALEAEPGERYHSGAEFFNAFRKVLSGPS